VRAFRPLRLQLDVPRDAIGQRGGLSGSFPHRRRILAAMQGRAAFLGLLARRAEGHGRVRTEPQFAAPAVAREDETPMLLPEPPTSR
jgi:hypothetical protein